ncbi:MAG: hypothetical protein NTW50_02540 [Candidatus Berkelbacteria bacterium]|nr:hypothetical protein [Candidatus Berkelbacteria bacterium]
MTVEEVAIGREVEILSLASLIDIDCQPVWRTVSLRLAQINRLEQVRKTVEGIENLAANIEELGNLEPMLVVRYDREKMIEYVSLINEEWSVSREIEEMVATDESGQKFNVIIAGHRRLDALERLGLRKAEVRLCENISPFVALFVQLSENLHMPVKKCEEAVGRVRLFRLIRKRRPELTMKQFAPHVGVSVDQLRDEMKFVDLPEVIQRSAEDGDISFGVAVEFDRLIKLGQTDPKIQKCFGSDWIDWLLENCLKKAIVEKLSYERFRKETDFEIKMALSRQLGLFDLELSGSVKKNYRQAIVTKVTDGIKGAVKYLRHVLDRFNNGNSLLQPEESPFLDRQFRALFLEFLHLLEAVITHLKFLSQREKEEALTKTRTAIGLCDQLDKNAKGQS